MTRTALRLAVLAVLLPVATRADEPAKGAAAPAPAAATAPAKAAPVEQTPDMMVAEVVVIPYNKSASYGPVSVRGPQVNLTDSGDGRWKGNIRDLNGVFTVTEKRITGGNFNIVIDRDGEEWVAQGTVDGKRVRIAWEKDGIVARYDNRLYDLKRVAPDLWASVETGPGIRVRGDAAQRTPMFPQFIFALVAVL